MGERRRIGLLVIVLLSPIFLGYSCEEPPSSTGGPPTQCGRGSGIFELSFETNAPDTFNCSTRSFFYIEIDPDINNSFQGWNRVWFQLYRVATGESFKSNYREFLSSDEAVLYLEWGGSLPTGYYELDVVLQNIQDICIGDEIYEEVTKDGPQIYIVEFPNPQKMMNIEYDYQTSDTGAISAYNVLLSPYTLPAMNSAYRVANTDYTLLIDDVNLTTQSVVITTPRVSEYIRSHKDVASKMYLCGVKQFVDVNGILEPDIMGATISDPQPTDSSGSLIAVKTIITNSSHGYGVDYLSRMASNVVHELGHQRGNLVDTWYGHSSIFCTMYPTDVGNEVRYVNPHFCDNHLAVLKNVSW